MNFRKNDVVEIKIDDITTDGMGIGRADGFAFFVAGAAPGDEIRMRVVKLKKSYGYGIIERIISPSHLRCEPPCHVYKSCGGCSLQHIEYEAQLEIKRNYVKNSLIRIGGLPENTEVEKTVGTEFPFGYRNKGQYPVGTKNGKTVCGFYAPRSHNIIPLSGPCLINRPTDEPILKAVTEIADEYNIPVYNENDGTGILRHILIRTSENTGEIMVCIVINSDRLPHSDKITERLRSLGIVSTVLININKKNTNVILGEKNRVLFGKGYITDTIGDLCFKISPLSFFQVNPVQTEKLYNRVLELADPKKDEIIFDAYCGTGTISLFLARRAKAVHAVEIVSEAVSDARFNAEKNGITNVSFYVGAAEKIYPELCAKGLRADTVITDPPRKGCDPSLLKLLTDIAPKKIVYVSCNPSTLARDLKYLTHMYYPQRIIPVDMFPQTTGVECCCCLIRK